MDSGIDSISIDSPWHKGPSYLCEAVEHWPIDRNFALRKEACIPNEEILKRYRGQVHEVKIDTSSDQGIHKLIDL